MENIIIDTDKVRIVANEISTFNKKLDNEFVVVDNAISYMENGWVSPAKNTVISNFNKLKNQYITNSSNSRNSVINQCVKFLNEFIGNDTDTVECNNASLADAFK